MQCPLYVRRQRNRGWQWEMTTGGHIVLRTLNIGICALNISVFSVHYKLIVISAMLHWQSFPVKPSGQVQSPRSTLQVPPCRHSPLASKHCNSRADGAITNATTANAVCAIAVVVICQLHCGRQTDAQRHPDVPNQHAERRRAISDFEVILQFRSRLISLFL